MHLWIWMLQTLNADSLTIILHISWTNVQRAIFAVLKGISHVIVALQSRTVILQDLHSLSSNHDPHHITSIRPLGDYQVLVAH